MSTLTKRKQLTLTEGPLFKKIFIFAFPLICTNLLQILFNAADMIVVGRFSTVEGAVGAVGSTASLINLLLNLVFGIAVGANVVVANAIGARDEERTRVAVHSSIWVGLVCGIIGVIVGSCFSKPLLLWMDADPQLIDMSVTYTKIYFWSSPFICVLNYAISILRAKGDTKTPLFIMTGAGVLNVTLNVIFVAGMGMNVDGVAYASLISNGLASIAILVKMSRDDDWCRFEIKRMFAIKTKTVLQILKIGIPSGIQSSLFALSNVFVQRAINGFGKAVISANSICVNVEGLAYTAANAITQASVTFAGQNMGAKKYNRLGMIIRDCYGAGLLVGGAASVFILLFRETLFSFYLNPQDPLREEILAATVIRTQMIIIP
ncbi:MAG: MATE family efflux transporter, partial [Clostridia bacterium]|nr:MATE family efflux transporter [Clostridia bacterium]